ncbi:hypothetical protein HJB80_02720 [Rhizobium lentis]|uniref:hypothetical protein n=1 Tax=Rhizobium lentis TaxID=1138194 RepID=UPI001C832202|nr:hypothetical protein [Rhizobium lentis]MBX5131605.1 hypothetical protein [Rhizobium lentis]
MALPPFAGGFQPWLRNNSDTLLAAGAGLLSGQTPQEQAAGLAQGVAGVRQRNRTIDFLRQQSPELAAAVESGALSGGDAYKLFYAQKLQAEKPKNLSFETLPDGTYGNFDRETGTFNSLGKVEKAGGMDDYSNRANAAKNLGLAPDDPRYQSFVLTGKMPREDAQPLTTTDKKAILEADDAISTNKSAIGLLDQAIKINDKANSGWFAGTRAMLGNNLPDYAVPDALSSPESSAATTEYDNLVQQGALSQLKTIFGGNPTEGERSILLELQASSNKPPEIRKKILMRAKELAMARLALNQQRSDQLRGGDFYKPQGGMSGGNSVQGAPQRFRFNPTTGELE